MYKKSNHFTNKFAIPLALALGLSGIIPVYAANLPDSPELIRQLGIPAEKLANLEHGETVSFEIQEDSKKELAAGVVMYIPATPSKVIEFVRTRNLAAIDTDVSANGVIPTNSGADALKGFGFTSKQSKEATNFLEADAGEEFNLSTQELKAIKSIKAADEKASREAASQGYRNILMQRLDAYRKNGLKGIAAYSRNGAAANPAEELRNATVNNQILTNYFPDLHSAWLNYPAALPKGAEEQFLWLNRKIENRPTPILEHRIMLTAAHGAVILSRQFYVGHSYNSSQLTIGCLPYKDGSLIFYANRTSTDQVAGMGSSLKHSIGREQMRDEIINRLKKLRQLLKTG